MVKDNPYSTNISFLISEQIPDHIRNDHELYDAFMTAYYEWLERVNNPLYMSEHLYEFRDIDATPDYFFNHLKNEILSVFPQNVLADKALLARFAKDFYERKGTVASYKFLFKALYNEDIEIVTPKDYILKASDGRWVVDYYIMCQKVEGNPFDLMGEYVYTSKGYPLFIDNVILENHGPYEVYKIYVPSSSDMELDVGEELKNQDETITIKTYGVLKDIEVKVSGNNYQIGDYIPIRDPYGVDGTAKISSLRPTNTISGFQIVNGGSNYRVGDQLVFTPVNGGFGAIAYVSQITNSKPSDQCITTIETEQSVVSNDVKDTRVIDYVRFENFEIGSISAIKLVDGGREYIDMPKVSIYQEPLYDLPHGSGAIIKAISKNYGQVVKIDVMNHGVGYKKSEIYPIIDLSEMGDGTAVAKANVYSGVIKSKGYWLDNRGKLSSTVYLQDNYYYQNYSYLIKSTQSINNYKDIVTNVVHLAGTQLFGEVDLNEILRAIDRYPNGLPYSPSQFLQIIYDQYVDAGVKIENEWRMHVNTTTYKTYAEIYGTIYYIKDFAYYTITMYWDLRLNQFVAIYQDLLLGDMLENQLNVMLDTPLNELYGSTRYAPDHAFPAEICVRKIAA